MKNTKDVIIKALDQVTTFNYILLDKDRGDLDKLKNQNQCLMKEVDTLVEENNRLKKENELLSRNMIKNHEDIFHSPPFWLGEKNESIRTI